MYEVRLLPQAVKQLEALDPSVQKRVVKRMKWLSENAEEIKPEALTSDLAGLFKLRVGDYRVVFQMLDRQKQIIVHLIGHRREVYDKS